MLLKTERAGPDNIRAIKNEMWNEISLVPKARREPLIRKMMKIQQKIRAIHKLDPASSFKTEFTRNQREKRIQAQWDWVNEKYQELLNEIIFEMLQR